MFGSRTHRTHSILGGQFVNPFERGQGRRVSLSEGGPSVVILSRI